MKYMYFYSYEYYENEKESNNIIGKGFGNLITDTKITNNSILNYFLDNLRKKIEQENEVLKGKRFNIITLSYLGEATDEE